MSPFGEFISPGNLVNHTRGQKAGPKAATKGLSADSSDSTPAVQQIL
jgi:hypothetical protein